MTNRDKVIEELARVGYERMFDDKWADLPLLSIERALWKEVADVMLDELWRLWEESKRLGVDNAV